MTSLGTLFGTGYSAAFGINDSGEITGYSYNPSIGDMSAFLYSGGVMADLGGLPGYPFSSGQCINATGEVAGHLNNGAKMSSRFCIRTA